MRKPVLENSRLPIRGAGVVRAFKKTIKRVGLPAKGLAIGALFNRDQVLILST